MELFFNDPDETRLPPDEVRIKRLHTKPQPDGRRVRVFMDLTPFQKKPSGEVRILNAQGEEVAAVNIIEAFSPRMEFTLHLRGNLISPFTLQAVIFYTPDLPLITGGAEHLEGSVDPTLPSVEEPIQKEQAQPLIVDRAEVIFEFDAI